jgi:hypothetical protein
MKSNVVCCYCGIIYKVIETDTGHDSHGICQTCYPNVLKSYGLDKPDAPKMHPAGGN